MSDKQKNTTGKMASGLSERDIASMIRVDQAGEYGATRIYGGQLAVMGDRSPLSGSIAAMAKQEDRHLDSFNAMIARRNVRPTVLQPIWNVAGYALGAATAAIGPKAAMACTVAVETEIDLHYQEQLDVLGETDPELIDMITDFQAEELEHKEIALAAGAEEAIAYPLMSAAIRFGCRAAIALSKRF